MTKTEELTDYGEKGTGGKTLSIYQLCHLERSSLKQISEKATMCRPAIGH